MKSRIRYSFFKFDRFVASKGQGTDEMDALDKLIELSNTNILSPLVQQVGKKTFIMSLPSYFMRSICALQSMDQDDSSFFQTKCRNNLTQEGVHQLMRKGKIVNNLSKAMPKKLNRD